MRRNRFLLWVLLLPSSLSAQARPIDWSTKEDLPFPNMSGEAVVCGGVIHVVGGRRGSGENGTYHYTYQPQTNAWEEKASLQTGRANLALACVDGKVFAIGGDPFLDSVEIYDPETDEWSYGAPMPTPRQHIDAGVVDGKVYVIGGLESWAPAISDRNEVYDPTTDRWETKAPIPTPRHNPAIEVVEGKIYVLGGGGVGDQTWTKHSAVEVYDPETDLWVEMKSLPEARFKPATAVVSNKIYVIGGRIGDDVVPNVDVFDPLKNTWSDADDLPKPVVFSGAVSMGNRIFVLGGCDGDFNPYESNLVGSVAPDPLKVTYIANAGFLVESSTRKVLIDALFEEGWGQYLTPTPAIRTRIINGQAPFDEIDLVLVTHGHGDHFEASLVGQQLRQTPTAFLTAPTDAVNSMRELPEYRDMKEQIYEASPPRFESEKVTLNGIDLEIVRLQHDTRPQIQNIGFLLKMDGNTLLHVGDNTGVDREEFESYLFNDRGIDIAFLNHYGHWSTEEERAFTKQFINPAQVILTHVPPDDVDRVLSEVEAIPQGFPPIRVPSQPMEVLPPLAPGSLQAERAAEVPMPPLPRQAVALLESFQGEGAEEARNAIPRIQEALRELHDQHSRFLLLRALFSFHAQAGNLEASYAVLREAVEEGFYFSLRTGENPYPPFLPEFEAFVGYEEMLAANESLRALDEERSVLEYFVSLPEGYDPERSYPLVMVLHGGGGNHAGSALNWVSPGLQAGYIVAFVQGSRCYGSYTKSFFGGESVEELAAAYEQLSGNYPVDPNQVLLAAESSGAIVALDLTLEEKIPVAGLLLAFPHYPSEPEDAKIRAAAERGVRAVLLNGEHDWRLPRQKALGVAFDRNGLPNRFIVYPGIGHELPNDLATEIDRSLEFLAVGKAGSSG